ncbi:MAG: aldo/keto reductase [Burkholderiaceae bacterium]
MTRIERTALGRTGLQVSRIGFGAMELRGPFGSPGRPADHASAAALLHAVLDAGINFIDTSPDYGESEELIGEALASRRDEFVLASKCGCPCGTVQQRTLGASAHDYTRANIRRGVEDSLRRLRTDRLDLLQVHLSPARAVLERDDTLGELQRLQREGKVRFIGMSGTLPHLRDHIAMQCFDVFQVPYSAMAPEHHDMIAKAAQAGAGIIVRGAVWRGLPFFHSGPLARIVQVLRKAIGRPDQWQASGLGDLLQGIPVREFLLRFTLSHPGQSTTIVGTSNAAHLAANVEAAAKGPLPADVYAQALRRVANATRGPRA